MKKSVYITAALGGMFTALFFICSNVIPPIQLFPGVPITLQIFCVALMAAVLGLRGGLLTMTCIYLLTLAGLPMSAGYTGGIAAFVKPTTGYFIGFSLLAAVIGAYTEFLLPVLKRLGWFTRLYKNKPRLLAADALLFLAVGVVAVCADHLCGAAWLCVYNSAGSVWLTFAGSLAGFFLPDFIKIIAAAAVYVSVTAALSNRSGLLPLGGRGI